MTAPLPQVRPDSPRPGSEDIELSVQELRILSLFADGLPLRAVARRTDLSSRTGPAADPQCLRPARRRHLDRGSGLGGPERPRLTCP